MKFLIAILWLIVFTKKLFFWVWLWQLKEYHLRRFKAHFRTDKGKKIILNNLLAVKIILFMTLAIGFNTSILLLLLFLAESGFAFRRWLAGTFRKPVLTQKTLLIVGAGVILELFLAIFAFSFFNLDFFVYLLVLDILAPLIFSGLVLVFEPVAIYWRKKIIREAQEKREKAKNLLVIGITGSYGKTSTKEFLYTILSQKFNVLKTKEHQNSEVGISRCILNDLKEEHEVFICEMGAYSKGGIKLLASIAKPKIGILAGINEQHLATFGSLENIIKTKYELIESLPEDGKAIFNGFNPYCKELFNKTTIKKNLTTKDIKAKDIKVEREKLSFKVVSGKKKVDFELSLLGKHWIEDLLLAIQAARELGMSFEEIVEASKKIQPFEKAMKLLKSEEGFHIIDSSYSANLSGVLAHLDYLNTWTGKKAIIMPCLIELGAKSEEIHRKIGERIGEVCDLAIITTKDYFDFIKTEAVKKGMKRDNILFVENSEGIFEEIRSFKGKEDVILLESRVPKRLFSLFKV